MLTEVAQKTGGTAIVADLAKAEDCGRIAEEAVAALGGEIDAVVHTAGVSPLMRIDRTPPGAWQRSMATNVIGPVLVTSAVLPSLTESALVAFTSSRSVGRPYHGVGPYSASKAALDQAVLSLRLENPRIRFTRVEIGDTAGTDFNRDFDTATRSELAPLWLSHGVLSEVLMDCDDLASLITAAPRAAPRPSRHFREQPGLPRRRRRAHLVRPEAVHRRAAARAPAGPRDVHGTPRVTAKPLLSLRFDFRNPEFAGTAMSDRYAAALDMAEWADGLGFAAVTLSEHHGFADGYLPHPSPWPPPSPPAPSAST
ncbi:SDR family oxidoreductase [Yinghuangia aomiensis]